MSVSELFKNIFDACSGSSCRDCDCGITYFDTGNDWDWDGDELEKLKEMAIKSPDEYIEIDFSVSGIEIDDNFFVDGCKCGRAESYENFIKNEGSRIADYLNKRSEKLAKYADTLKVK